MGARHLGKLVTCPECGEPTHPLAEQIVSLQGVSSQPLKIEKGAVAVAPQSGAAALDEQASGCANCGQVFGRLQQRASWRGHSVCPSCHARLAGEITAVDQAAGVSKPSCNELSDVSKAEPPLLTDSTSTPRAAQKVAVRRVPESSSLPDSARLLAQGVQTAGRLALLFRMGSPARARRSPTLIDADPSELALAGEPPARVPAASVSVHSRLFFVLVILTVTGVAVYGALSLLQALAGYLTAAAFILLAVVGGYLLLRASLSASRRLLPTRSSGRTRPTPTLQKGG